MPLDPHYFTEHDKDIFERITSDWTINARANEVYWNEGTIDTRFVAGDQYLWNELYSHFPSYQKKRFNFNRLRRIRNMISGHQRRTRKSFQVLPIEGSDAETAEQFSETLNWVLKMNDGYQLISEAFEGALTTGMNILSVWMDYREDPINGDIRIENLKYNQVLIDQYFSKPDFSDARFLWTRKFMQKEQAASLMPERYDEIMELSGGYRDQKFRWLPAQFNLRNVNLVAYDEYWYLDNREAQILVDMESGETLEWKGSKDDLRAYLRDFPQVEVRKIQKPTVKLAILINDRVFYNGPNPWGIDKYSHVPALAYFESECPIFEWKIQGIIRGLRDAQFLYNRRRVIEMDMLESQINSGVKVMEGSLVDDNDAFLTGEGRALFIKRDAPFGMDSVQPIPPPQISPSAMQLSEVIGNEMQQIAGISDELLGMDGDDKAGITTILKQGAGLTTLEPLFDNLDRSQKHLGEIIMTMQQANWGPGKVRRILGREPSEQFFNKAFQKYDCVVAEGLLTETQKKTNFAVKLDLVKLGLPIPMESILQDAPLAGTKDILEATQKQQKAQEAAQQQAHQLEMMKLQAEINLANSRAAADRGLFLERASRVNENESLAIERRAAASLDEVKAVKELQGMDIENLQKLVDILSVIKGSQDAEGEKLNTIKESEVRTGKSEADQAQPQPQQAQGM